LCEDVNGEKALQECVAVVAGHVVFTISESLCGNMFDVFSAKRSAAGNF
jgi:hypothetical protein